jgi:hypothetical protein
MANPTGTWQVNGNGFRGELVIAAVDAAGNLNGTIYGDAISGFWDETTQRIFFSRNLNPNDPTALQVFTGYHFDANQSLFPKGPAVSPPAPPFQFRMLTGDFVAFAGGGGVASRPAYGWMARIDVPPP